MYEKTDWVDHIVDSTTGTVIQQGTRFTAQRMNNIEEGIEAVHELIESTNEEIENNLKQYADDKIAALVAAAPEALNTLKELAEALGDDPNFAATVLDQLTSKADASALTAHLADYVRQPGYGTTAGSTNTYTLTLSPALTAYAAGVCVAVKIHAANTGAATININGLGAKTILDSKGIALTSGKLKLNVIYTLRYDGTNFILQGDGGSGNAVASDLLSGKTASADAGDIVGAMVNWAGLSPSDLGYYMSGGSLVVAPQTGYHDSASTRYMIAAPNHIAANVKSGVTDLGITGTHPNISTGTAAPSGGYDNDYYIQT